MSDTLIRDLTVLRAYEPVTTNFKILCKFAQDDWKARLDLGLLEHSAVYQLLYSKSGARVSLSRLLNNFRLLHNPAFPEFPPSETRTWYVEHSLREWYPALDKGWRDLERDVLDMRNDCTDSGIDFLAFVVPGATTIIDNSWDVAVGNRADEYERGKSIRFSHDMFEREGVPHVRISDVIEKHPNPEELYFLRDGHFTAQGVRVVSEAIAAHLKEQYFSRLKS